MQPTAFISYSWDSLNEWGEENEQWVKLLADKLVRDNVKVFLDKWAVQPGDSIPKFMEKAITENDKVLIICTPRYKYSSDNRKGAVGYESHIISSLILQSGDHRKFITVIKQGNEKTSVPTALIGKYHIFLDNPSVYEKNYQVLIDAVHNRWKIGVDSFCTTVSGNEQPVSIDTPLNLSFAVLQKMTKQEIKVYIAHYKRMVQANSNHAVGWFGLGLCTLHYASHDVAIVQLRKAILLDGSNADYYYYLAIALCKGKRVGELDENTISEVHDNITKAIAINDEQAKYYLFLWIIYSEGHKKNNIEMVAYGNKVSIIEKINDQYKDIDEINRLASILKVIVPKL
jgi:tetratricopeptide (TPR) repeat protein